MNFKILMLFLFCLFGFFSCSKDELKDVDLDNNYYDLDYDFSNVIIIDSVHTFTYNIHPITGDTVLVKFYVDLKYNPMWFKDDIFTTSIRVLNQFFLNDSPFQLRKEPITNKYYIQTGVSTVKNNINSIKFLFSFYKDESNPTRTKPASNEFFFQL